MTTQLGPARPALHFAAQDTWINDPNGLIYHDGLYHLFYQANPHGSMWGNMSWGHATSPDLYRWEEHPIAIPCDHDEEIYSGSVVFDGTNSSGLGTPRRPPLVAIYTSAFTPSSPRSGTQAQSLAYSLDGGYTWTKHAGNPVLSRNSADFRDPKVFRYEGRNGSYWVMVAVEAVQRKVVVYSSANLIDWTYLSDFGPANAVDGVWECPDLFPLPLDGNPDTPKWVLTVNLNPGGPNGGSAGQYFVGDFDGAVFTPGATASPGPDGQVELRDCDWLDWGRDYYAAVSFNDAPDGKRIMLGWMNNWEYANHTPTAPWRGHMSLPRELSLVTRGGRAVLVQTVADEGDLRSAAAASEYNALRVSGELRLPDVNCSEFLIIDAEFRPGTASEFGLLIADAESTGTRIGVRAADGHLFLDRTLSGNVAFHESFASIETAPVHPDGGRYRLSVYVDLTSIEIFAQGGTVTVSDAVFPLPGARTLTVYANGGTVTAETLRITSFPTLKAPGRPEIIDSAVNSVTTRHQPA